jgi:predicted phage terminase large subunit-like protein
MGALLSLDDDALLELPEEESFEAEEMRRSFRLFCKRAWPVLEPHTPLSWGLLQDAMCEHLEAVSQGQIQNLIINVRPRSSKSRLVSIFWQAWEWISSPHLRWLTAAFGRDVAFDLSRKSLDLIRSPWYQARFGDRFRIRRDMSTPSHFGNTKGGERIISANNVGVTAKGGERLVWDDPHDAKRVESEADREQAAAFWRAFSSRGNQKTASIVVVGQRTHHNDAFALIERETERNWIVLKLPTRYHVGKGCSTPIRTELFPEGFTDPRTKEGEFLDPERHAEKEDTIARISLTPMGYAAQHDQEPTPAGGSSFRLEDFRRWRFVDEHLERGVDLPELDAFGRRVELIPRPGPRGEEWARFFEDLLWSWDFTFKGEEDSDWVVGQLWGRKGPRFYLLHQARAHMDFTASLASLLQTAALYPVVYSKLVESAANGPAIVSILQAHMLGLELVTTGGKGKPERARAVSPLVRAGAVYVPEDHVSWGEHSTVPIYLQELQDFPKGARDDQVDATSQALARLFAEYRRWLSANALGDGEQPIENLLAVLLSQLQGAPAPALR